MRSVARTLLGVLAAAAVVAPTTAFSTNGIFLIGQGAKSRGMGGVAIAFPQDALAGAVNPAAIGFVEDRVDVGADIFRPRARSRLGDLSYNSSANLFVFPAMGGTYKFNRKLSVGFSAIPAGGGGSRYNLNLYNNLTGANVNQTLGVMLAIMQVNPTASVRINKQNRIGASLVLSVQQFRGYGLDYFSNFTSTGLFTEKLSNNGNDYAYGAGVRLGWMGQFFNERLSLGAAYTSRIYMTDFDKYTDLFAENGSMDTPENFGVGMALKITPKLTVGADVTHTLYSNVNSIGNDSANKSGSPFPISQEVNALGKPQGLGFGWSDQTVFKVGVAYDYNPKWTLRTGWNYGKSPIDEKNGEILFGIVAPAVVQNHLTLGATYKPTTKMEWSFSYIHAFKYEQEGPTLIGDTGKLRMYQDALGVSFGYKL
jgi:long-chain fatty acid transport protein